MAYMHDQRDDLLYGGMSVICKQCNRKVLEKCISCGCFKPEKKPPSSALCGGCGQIKEKHPPEESTDEDDEEEEDYIKQSGGVLRRKCSCCNRARDSCTKCGRAYISDSEEDSEAEKDSNDAEEDNEEEEENSESEEEQTPAKKQKKAETKGGKK